MADGLGTITTMPPATLAYYDKVHLKRALPFLVHSKYGQRRPVPKGGGTQIKFRKINSLAVNKTPLGEGITPPLESLTKTDLLATLQQWGRRVGFSDMVDFTNPDAVLTDHVEVLGEVMGETIDEIDRDMLLGCPSIYRAGNVATRVEIITSISTTDLNRIERVLLSAKAKYYRQLQKAAVGFNTRPIAPAFLVLCHTDLIMGLKALGTSFTPVQEYPNPADIEEGEVGAVGNFRFIATTKSDIQPDLGGTAVTNALKYTTANTACDVYRSIVLAPDAYGVSDLAGEGMRTFIKKAGEGDDDLAQRNRVGSKITRTSRILNDAMMCIYECGTPL